MVVTSCSSDEFQEQEERIRPQFKAMIDDSFSRTVATDINSGTTLAEGTQIELGVFATGGAQLHKETLTVTDDKGNVSDVNYFLQEDESRSVLALVGWNGTSFPNTLSTSYFIYTVSQDQSTEAGYKASDILLAHSSALTYENNEVSLAFKHLGAKIIVNLSSVEYASSIKTAKVSLKNLYYQGRLYTPNLNVGELGGGSNYMKDILLKASTDEGTTACGIIIPQKVTAGTPLFEIVIGEETFTASLAADKTFGSGTVYTYNILIGGKQASVSSSSVTAWANDTDTDNKNLTITTPDA